MMRAHRLTAYVAVWTVIVVAELVVIAVLQ